MIAICLSLARSSPRMFFAWAPVQPANLAAAMTRRILYSSGREAGEVGV